MISSTGASADSVFVLDLRFSNFDQLNHAARRTRERSLRGMLNLAIFAIRVRSTNCNTTTVTHTHTACPSHHHRPHRTSPVFLRHHSDFFVNAFLVRVAMPMPNSRCCFAMQVRCFYGCEGPAVLLCGAEDAASTPTLTQTVTLATRDEKQVACWTEWLATTSSAPWVRIGAHWHLPSCVIFLFLFSIHRLLPDGGGGGGS